MKIFLFFLQAIKIAGRYKKNKKKKTGSVGLAEAHLLFRPYNYFINALFSDQQHRTTL